MHIERVCVFCGRQFFVHPCETQNGHSVFCSTKCRADMAKSPEAVATRFWPQVEKTESCWIWRGPTDDDGYGYLTVGRRRLRAHRLAWELIVGPIPGGLCVCHQCDNPPCVNPPHLFLATNPANTADRHAKARDARGERQSRARLTEAIVCQVRSDHALGKGTVKQLAAILGYPSGTIGNAISRATWRYLECP